MSEARRRQYRVEDPPLSVGVQFLTDGSAEVAGELRDRVVDARLDDLTISGARLRIAALHRVENGSQARLILGGDPLPAPVWLTARTTHCEIVGLDSAYGLRFDDAQAVERLLTAEVLRLFNRRCAERYGPGADEPLVPVQLTIEDEILGAELADLSTSGVGLRAHESELPASIDEVHLAFELPDAERPVAVTGRVVSRAASSGVARLGIELLLPDGQEGADVRGVLLAYVVRQQRRRAR